MAKKRKKNEKHHALPRAVNAACHLTGTEQDHYPGGNGTAQARKASEFRL